MRPQHGKAETGRLIRDTCRRRSLSFLLAIPYATFHVIRRRDLVGAYFSSYSSSGSSSSSSSAVSALQRDPLDPAWADRGVRRPVCCALLGHCEEGHSLQAVATLAHDSHMQWCHRRSRKLFVQQRLPFMAVMPIGSPAKHN